jgi:hypothetical protein
MIYELRTYWAVPSKLDDLLSRFRELTLEVFERYDMEVVGFWTPKEITEDTGSLVYILRFDHEEALEAAWAAFRADPDWIKGKEASQADGVLVEKVESVILQPTDFSPLQ